MRFFKKEILSNKLWLKATGAAVEWENAGDDTGILATDNQIVIDELDQAAARGIGGVIVLDQAEYEEIKKKLLSNPSSGNLLKERWSLSGLTLPVPSNLVGLVAATNPVPIHGQMSPHLRDVPKETPDPIKIETEFTRPKTAKGFFRKVE